MADKFINARLVVHNLDTMPDAEHKSLIDWLHKMAHDIRTTPRKKFSHKFTARLWKPGQG